jgi:glutathione S-transferase
MRLRYSPTSPYVRKVVATAIETGLESRIERIPTNVWDPGTDIAGNNPLGKIPALITDSGHILYDSPVICEYLDSLHDGPNLFPSAGGARWTALRRQALADGILDAGVGRLLESRRPEGEQSAKWIDRCRGTVARGLDALEGDASDLQDRITIGHIAIGCMLGWLDFRFADEDWRPDRPALRDWNEEFSARLSMTSTVPEE